MKYILSIFLILIATTSFSQETKIDINGIEPQVTLYTELNDVVLDIRKNEPNARYYRYFTSYAMPKELQNKALPLLSFCVHSLSSGFVVKKPVKISNTLYRIDIRDYAWTEQAIEDVAQIHPYLALDFMTKEYQERYQYMLQKSGNSLFRLDWFVIHTMDTSRQLDYGIKTIAYYTLLYANDKIPENIDDFRAKWSADLTKNKFLLKGTIVDGDDSIVSNHTRQLLRKNTEIGAYWETFDHPDFDYVEKLDRENAQRKAGEAISVNYHGLQVYLLFNGENGKRIDYADNTFVRDTEHPTNKSKRVITASSCMFCHSEGINPATNKLRKIITNKTKLEAEKDYGTAQLLESFYLDDLDSKIRTDSDNFKAAVLKTTGIETKELHEALRDLHIYYDTKITLPQAALECGVSVNTLIQKADKTVSGRLGSLLDGETMPRDRWDRLGADGKYGLAMIFVHSLDQKREFIDANAVQAVRVEPRVKPIEKQKTPPVKISDNIIKYKIKVDVADILDQNGRIIGKVLKGDELEPNNSASSNSQTVGVYYNGRTAWIRRSQIE